MTLGFSQEIKGVKNFFVEKIWTGLPFDIEPGYYEYQDLYREKFLVDWDGATIPADNVELLKPKLHTIRQGLNRWRAGMEIHMVINNRTANRFQFAPTIKCKSVQKIEIYHVEQSKKLGILSLDCGVIIDGRAFDPQSKEIKELAINDGFNSVDDFFAYFNEDFTGQLIHWTDLKY